MNIEEKATAPRGEIEYRIYRGGEEVEHVREHNLVVNGGRTRLAQLIAGKSTSAVNRLGVGTGTVEPALANTTLTGGKLFNVTGSTVSGANAIFGWELKPTDAVGMNITEFGLFAADGTMITRQVRGKVIGKDEDMRIVGTYTLSFTG